MIGYNEYRQGKTYEPNNQTLFRKLTQNKTGTIDALMFRQILKTRFKGWKMLKHVGRNKPVAFKYVQC